MKTVFKVFRRGPKGRLCSAIVHGKAMTIYPLRMSYGRKWLNRRGYWPTACLTKREIYKFVYSEPSFREKRWEVWECETPETSKPLGFQEVWIVAEGCIDSHLFDWWPDGTVFCHGIRPVRKLASSYEEG